MKNLFKWFKEKISIDTDLEGREQVYYIPNLELEKLRSAVLGNSGYFQSFNEMPKMSKEEITLEIENINRKLDKMYSLFYKNGKHDIPPTLHHLVDHLLDRLENYLIDQLILKLDKSSSENRPIPPDDRGMCVYQLEKKK